MSAMAQKAVGTFELLPEHQQALMLALMEQLLPDDVATPADREAIREGREAYARGEFISLEDYKAKNGL
jgi:hypothetical protein